MKIKFFRQIDRLGRLVIPVDLRKQYITEHANFNKEDAFIKLKK